MIDVDGNGTVDKSEFSKAAKAVGLAVKDSELDIVFKKYDGDGNGVIDISEFLTFFEEKQASFYDEDAVIVGKLSEEGLKSIIPYIGPAEASRGFKKALLILEKNPAAAAATMGSSPMRALHLLLMLDAPVEEGDGKQKKGGKERAQDAAKKAAFQAAVPLIQAIAKADPGSFQVRVQPKEDLPDGKLPLHLALERRWPKEVVQTCLKAFPDSATTIDAVKMKKGVRVAPSLKAGRWPRKIATEAKASPEVVALLPEPKKKGKEVEWLDQATLDTMPQKKGKK